MNHRHKILYSILALVFSFGATVFGFALLGAGSLDSIKKFIYGFFFLMQFVSTTWLVFAIFSKDKKNL